MSQLDEFAKIALSRMATEGKLPQTPDAGFTQGVRHGYLAAVEMLKTGQAAKKCGEGTRGVGSFVSCEEWAKWLETEMGEEQKRD